MKIRKHLPRYEHRFCCFLDIMGFSGLINDLDRHQTTYQHIREILRRIHHPANDDDNFRLADLRAQSISDAIAISALQTPLGLFQVVDSIQRLAIDLLIYGYFVRGALVAGQLYHDDNMVFGEALVRAYNLETQVVRYPRIMISSEVIRAMDIYEQTSRFWQGRTARVVRQSEDGPRYLHYLKDFEAILTSEVYKKSKTDLARRRLLRPYAHVPAFIRECLQAAMDTPRHYEKVRWLAIYWNSCIRPIDERTQQFMVLPTA